MCLCVSATFLSGAYRVPLLSCECCTYTGWTDRRLLCTLETCSIFWRATLLRSLTRICNCLCSFPIKCECFGIEVLLRSFCCCVDHQLRVSSNACCNYCNNRRYHPLNTVRGDLIGRLRGSLLSIATLAACLRRDLSALFESLAATSFQAAAAAALQAPNSIADLPSCFLPRWSSAPGGVANYFDHSS